MIFGILSLFLRRFLVAFGITPGFLFTLLYTYLKLNSSHSQLSLTDVSSSSSGQTIEKTPKYNSNIKIKQIPQNIPTTAKQMMDPDVAFIAGETEMPLTVYESPLLDQFRRFRKALKAYEKQELPSLTDQGYYIIEKSPNEIQYLYGRGPSFKMDQTDTGSLDD